MKPEAALHADLVQMMWICTACTRGEVAWLRRPRGNPRHLPLRYLALALLLLIQGNVGHLLAGVEERVLGRFGHDVLRGVLGVGLGVGVG